MAYYASGCNSLASAPSSSSGGPAPTSAPASTVTSTEPMEVDTADSLMYEEITLLEGQHDHLLVGGEAGGP